jgi:hypothetical protein
MDFAWITNDVGDITAVNVTSPITGGGSSGAVTIGINAATTSVVGAVQLSDSTSTTSSVLASTPTATKAAYDLADAAIAKSVVTTAGDIIYRDGSAPVRLGIGTAGQVLKVNSGATAPEWSTDKGKVLQVVNVIYGTETSTASSAFSDTGLTATITPTSATSQILALVTMPVYKDTTNTNGEFKLIRTSTTIATMSNVAITGTTGGIDVGTTSINYLDSPATTSATTYKVQFCSQANSSRVVINRAGGQTNQSSITLMEIGA